MSETKKRDHLAEGKASVEKFIIMCECLTELSANACHAAAEAKSADIKDIGKDVDALLAGISTVASVGSMLIASLASTRIQLDKATEQLANLNALDKIDSAPTSDEVKDMVATALMNAANRKG